MKLIEVNELKDRKDGFCYAVDFNGALNSNHFNLFAQMLSRLDTKFELETGWLINESGLQRFKALDEAIFGKNADKPKQKTKTMKEKMGGLISVSRKIVEDWKDVGVGMKLQPYDYQKQVIKFITTPHGPDNSHDTLIVSPCGSGKTPILIGAYLECHNQGIVTGPGMIVVKASLKPQWLKEVTKFTHLTPRIIKTFSECTESETALLKTREARLKRADDDLKASLKKEIKEIKSMAKRKFEEQFKGVDLFILNYETLNDEKVQKAMKKVGPEFVGSDESHYIKGADNKRSRSLYKFNDAKVKVGATATPVQRDPRDIYGIFKFVHPDTFVNSKSFNAMYVKYGYGYQVIGAKNEKLLNEKIAPYMFILTKSEVAKQLPKLVVSQRYCDLTDKQLEVNDTFKQELDELSEKRKAITKGMNEAQIRSSEEVKSLDAAISSRQTFLQELTISEELLKLSDSPIAKKFITGSKSSKLAALKDIVLEVVESGEKLCIFSRFAKLQPIIADALHSVPELSKMKIAYIRGDLDADVRYEEAYTKFCNDDDYKVLVSSDAGAEGLNLSQCKYMVEMEPAVSYAIQTQRHGRLERADSVHDNVHVIQLIANDSWDEVMLKSIAKKEQYDMSIIKGIDKED